VVGWEEACFYQHTVPDGTGRGTWMESFFYQHAVPNGTQKMRQELHPSEGIKQAGYADFRGFSYFFHFFIIFFFAEKCGACLF
jgi:hypothetical protein